MWYLWPNFFVKINLKRHIVKIHERKKKCECLYATKKLRKHSSEVHEGRTVWLNTLLQFTMLRNHSNVTFVTPVFTKRNTLLRFMKLRNLSHVIYLCNQSYFKKERLRRHISAVHWKVIWSKKHILSVHDEETKLFKCSNCEALVLKKSTSGFYFCQILYWGF